MELRNEFRVGVPPDTAWEVLNDVERIAPCLPGAQLFEVVGDEYRGVVRVKVGPITAQYKGKASVVEQDRSTGRIVLRASGRDVGAGSANATITAVMTPENGATRIQVMTDLSLTGKAAEFGRGFIADMSAGLLSQFVEGLERELRAAADAASGSVRPGPQPAAADSAAAAEGAAASADPAAYEAEIRRLYGPDVEPVNVLPLALWSITKRLAPFVGGGFAVFWAIRSRRRGNSV